MKLSEQDKEGHMKIYLDIRRLNERTEAHEYLKEQLGFPEYYGRNLDALFDYLTEIGETDIYFEHRDFAESYFELIYQVFETASDENPDLRIHFSLR